MKKLYSNLIQLFIVLAMFVSCAEEENGMSYSGDPLLHFSEKTIANETIDGDVDTRLVKIKYGTANAVSGTHSVSLVFDAANSNAIEGMSFEIVDGTDEITNGESTGEFTVKIINAGIKQNKTLISGDDKTLYAVFKLASPTLALATDAFSDTYTMNMDLYCPPPFFLGNSDFKNTGWWNGSTGTIVQIESGATDDAYVIKNYFEPGYDFNISFNSANEVTFEEQNTGYFSAANGGYIWVKMGAGKSTYIPCERTLNLSVNFFIPGVGAYGDKSEVFVGLP